MSKFIEVVLCEQSWNADKGRLEWHPSGQAMLRVDRILYFAQEEGYEEYRVCTATIDNGQGIPFTIEVMTDYYAVKDALMSLEAE